MRQHVIINYNAPSENRLRRKPLVKIGLHIIFFNGVVAFSVWNIFFTKQATKVGIQRSSNERNILRGSLEASPKKNPDTVTENLDKTLKDDLLNLEWGGKSRLKFGFTMREFSERVLTRKITSSDVLVVSPSVDKMSMKSMKNNLLDFEESTNIDIGESFTREARKEGHTVHEMNSTSDVGIWWNSFTNSTIMRPSWILLAVFNPSIGREDDTFLESRQFLKESTITYLIFRISASRKSHLGTSAIRTLLDFKYKIQILSVSHFSPSREKWGPNSLITDLNMNDFFAWGESSGKGEIFEAYIFATQGLDLAIPSRSVYIPVAGGERDWNPIDIQNVIYASCPTRHKAIDVAFIDETAQQHLLYNTSKITILENLIIRVNSTVPWEITEIQQFPNEHSNTVEAACVRILFLHQDLKETESATACTTRILTEGPKKIQTDNKTPLISKSSHVLPSNLTHDYDPQSAPEIASQMPKVGVSAKERVAESKRQANILLIMLDPMSRLHFKEAFSKTREEVVGRLGLYEFNRYAVVGDNSGPNQSALYAGIPLKHRNDISQTKKWIWDELKAEGYTTMKVEGGCIENSNMVQSAKPNTTHGNSLSKMFCFDFDRPNCLGKKLVAEHVIEYGKQFIDTYKGQQPWAAFMSFLDGHEDTMTLAGMLDKHLSKFLEWVGDHQKDEDTLLILVSDHGLHYGPYFQSQAGEMERQEPLLYLGSLLPYASFGSNDKVLERKTQSWITPYDVHATIKDFASIEGKEYQIGTSLLEDFPSERSSCMGTGGLIPEKYCQLNKSFHSHVKGEESCKVTPFPPSVLSFFADIPQDHRQKWPTCQEEKSTRNLHHGNFQKKCRCATSHREWYECDHHPWNIKLFQREDFAFVDCPNSTLHVENRILRQPQLVKRSKKYQSKNPNHLQSEKQPNILVIEVDSVSVAYADRFFPKTKEVLRKYRSSDGSKRCKDGLCSVEFEKFGIVGPNSISNQLSSLSGCLSTNFKRSCFIEKGDRDCTNIGRYRVQGRSCRSCPSGTFLRDPLHECAVPVQTRLRYKLVAKKCCTSRYPQTDPTRFCKDVNAPEHGSQLLSIGPGQSYHSTYCPRNGNDDSPFIFDVAKSLGYVTYFGEEFCWLNSPYVLQDTIFPLNVDYALHKSFCRLVDRNSNDTWTVDNYGNLTHPEPCVDGLYGVAKQKLGLDQLSQIWNSYSDLPKFAYLNSIVAHEYAHDFSKLSLGAEAYDEHLSTFLIDMLSSGHADNTFIVIRSDHGLQGGAVTMDYSFQLEHSRPWTEMIYPEKLYGESTNFDLLYANRDKLVTGFDLYATIRGLMTPRLALEENGKHSFPPIPKWSYDLLTSHVPWQRTCHEAKIPAEYCPCDSERADPYPSVGIFNMFERRQNLYYRCQNSYLAWVTGWKAGVCVGRPAPG